MSDETKVRGMCRAVLARMGIEESHLDEAVEDVFLTGVYAYADIRTGWAEHVLQALLDSAEKPRG